MNYDKGAEYVFGFTDAYDVECWEFKNNTSDACNFLGPVPEIWVDDFEARYPEETTEIGRFREMHNWVVSTKGNLEKFKMEFENYFDMHFSLIYYVYTFFALMVDQRAKNMFLTYWGKTDKWYPYFYDNDTSYGINNEGQLIYDYYHEDTDQLDGANVYNGQNSVLWSNFREAFPDEIKATYQDLRSTGVLNYDELIDQFITKGSDKWSESIYNEDADFKYISMLYSDNDATNLWQVRGTGEEHFRYFIENRINYCDSKWYAADYADDYILLRIYTPQDENGNPRTDLAVAANADITVIPFSNMYAGVRYKANGTLYQKRVEANDVVTFDAPNEIFNNTETAIYGASQLSSLVDLSPLYCGGINVSKATKLTELIIGNGTEGYSNPNLIDLSVGTNNLLKVLNIQNCPKLTDPLALSGCPNIEEIYAAGSGITGVELANSGYLKIIELPATIANLSLKNQLYIETLTLEGYDAIKTINIENCPTVASLDILGAATNVERVRLTNVDWSYDTVAEVLALADRNLAGIDENGANIDKMWIDGKCHIKALSGAEYLEVKEAFPYMTITYDSLTAELIFMSEDGTTELTRQTIQNGGNGTDPVTAGTISKPTKESTAQYHFTYSGWSLTSGGVADPNALKNVEADRTVYVAFSKELRSYTVRFYNGTTLLQTSTVQYGGDAVYSGSTPVNNSTGNPADFEFYGWKPSPTNIQGDTNCYAQFHDLREITDSWETIAAAVADGTATSKYSIGAFKQLDIGATPLPYDFECGAAVMYNDEVHILGTITSDYKKAHYKWTGSEWVEVSTLPYDFAQGAAVVYNNEIHIIGSNASSLYRTRHYKWDGATWTEVSELPYSFANGSAIVYNNEIHILGSSKSYTTYYKWDGSVWTEVSTLPYDYYAGSVVVYNGELHLLGSSDYGKKHYKYDGSAWTSVSTLPYSFSYGSAFVYNNEIHLLGGTDSKTNHYKWNGTAWAEVEALPYSFDFGSSVITDTEIYLMGGSVDATVFCHYSFEESKWSKVGVTESIPMQIVAHNHDELPDGVGKWENLGDLPHMFYRASCVELNGEIHILGSDYGTHSKKHYKYDGSSWTSVSTLPYSFDYGSAVVHNNEIHILGCSDADTSHYKWNGTEWVSVSTLPYNFYRGIAVVFNNEIHIMGSAHTSYRLVHYKWDGSAWTSVGAPPYGVQDTAAVVLNNEIHILGSYMNGSRAAHYKYDGSAWTQVSTIPYDFYSGSAVVLNNQIHILGTNSTVEGRTNHYSWNGSNWTEESALPFGLYDGCALVYNGKVTIVGSYEPGYNKKFVQLVGASWEQIISQYLNDVNSGVAVYNNELYLARSWNTGLYKWDGSTWVSVVTSPVRIESNRLVVYNNELYIFWFTNNVGVIYKWNGSELTSVSNPDSLNINPYSVCVYNGLIHAGDNGTNAHYTFDGSTWTNIGTTPNTIAGGEYGFKSWSVYNNAIYSIGNNHLSKYNGSEWVVLDDIPFLSYSSSIIEYNGEMHVIGCRTGISSKAVLNMHYVYNGVEWRKELDSPINGHVQTAVYRGHLLCGGYILTNPRATLTFLAGNLLKDSRIMSTVNTKPDSWNVSELRGYLNNEFLNTLPSDLSNALKVVNKYSDDTDANIVKSEDTIWLPSVPEMGVTHQYISNGQGEAYDVFTDKKSRVRSTSDGVNRSYWVRSRYIGYDGYFSAINENGDLMGRMYNNTFYVLPGFCI